MVEHQVESRWFGLNSYLRDFVSQINMPGFSRLSPPLDTELIRHKRSKTRFPLSNGLMGEDKAAL